MSHLIKNKVTSIRFRYHSNYNWVLMEGAVPFNTDDVEEAVEAHDEPQHHCLSKPVSPSTLGEQNLFRWRQFVSAAEFVSFAYLQRNEQRLLFYGTLISI